MLVGVYTVEIVVFSAEVHTCGSLFEFLQEEELFFFTISQTNLPRTVAIAAMEILGFFAPSDSEI